MHEDPVTRRAARREGRRKQLRRRRVVALGCAAALGALALGGWTVASGRQGSVETHAAASQQRPTMEPTARSRLGSGEAVTLAFGGDVHFESPIRERLATSPARVLAPIAPVLRRADIAMVNLETAVTDRGVAAPKEFVFRAPASAFTALKAGGVDVATIANNHGMDFGKTGLGDTLKAAKARGVPVVGAGWNDRRAYAPHRVTVHGQRLAIMGATQVLDDNLIAAWSAGPGKPGLASAKNEPRLVHAVREARRTSDTVVVYLHWGVELQSCPTGDQTSLADRLVAAGADVVVGSHAHVLLGAGMKQKAFVAYGLGNFVFYASREITSQTGVLEVTVTGRRVGDYRWVPARISGGIPRPLSGSARTHELESWKQLRSCTDLGR